MAKIVLKKGQFPEIEDVGKVADNIGVSCYIVGGFVRDLLLGKENDDFDFLTTPTTKVVVFFGQARSNLPL